MVLKITTIFRFFSQFIYNILFGETPNFIIIYHLGFIAREVHYSTQKISLDKLQITSQSIETAFIELHIQSTLFDNGTESKLRVFLNKFQESINRLHEKVLPLQ